VHQNDVPRGAARGHQGNHQLDCQGVPQQPDGNKPETDQEKINRLAGAWDSACAFEAEYDWHQMLRETY